MAGEGGRFKYFTSVDLGDRGERTDFIGGVGVIKRQLFN